MSDMARPPRDWLVALGVTLALALVPPLVAGALVMVAGPFHASYVFIAWPCAGVAGMLAAWAAARVMDDEHGCLAAIVAALVVGVGWLSAPWLVGALGGWAS